MTHSITKSIINHLAPATIHKIAAGEVIERPANVVKELVENALDAGSSKITINIEDGGMDLIRVSDNGIGMIRDDALAAWLPHTTSKIRDAEDLSHVSTYGFRGEALCSMAAVSEMTIETRHASSSTGISVAVSGSREVETREIPRNPGTTVTVRNLFLHSPVRRKFMGSGKAEATRIVNMVGRIALAHPDTGFKVADRGREILAYTEGTLKHRVGEILGFNITNDLVPVNWSENMGGGNGSSAGSIHVEGYICMPQQARLRASHQYFYINRRVIQSGLISRALSQSYDVLPPGRFPMAVLFLTLPPEDVDVNVHPTKKEVRFLNESRIYWSISQAVKTALRSMVETPMLDLSGAAAGDMRAGGYGSHMDSGAPEDMGADSRMTESGRDAEGLRMEAGSGLIGNSAPPFLYTGFQPESTTRIAEPSEALSNEIKSGKAEGFSSGSVPNQIRLFPSDAQGEGPTRFLPTRESDASATPGTNFRSGSSGEKFSAFASRPRGPEIPYLQLHNGFILFGVESGLMMVNQQAAHERILYEKALEEQRQPGRFSSQQLLFPEVLELPPAEGVFLEEHLGDLQALGFDIESFGGSAFQLRGLPTEVKPDQARRVVVDMVQGLMRPERNLLSKSEDFQQRLAKVYARVTCVRLGDPLDYPLVSALIDGLFATQNPYVSPSGAPIVVRYSMEDIQRKFGLKT